MKKGIYQVLGAGVLIGTLSVSGSMKGAFAEVSININIGPPPIIVAEPPAVVMIPGSAIYFIPQIEFDIFFYNGYWWSPRGSQWYRSRAYNGPWEIINKLYYVPVPVYLVPKDYRRRYERERHIPYGEWKKHAPREWKEHGERGDGRKGDKHNRGHGK